MPRPGRSTPARAPDLDARAAPAETAPWQRFTTVGDATRRDTRPSTARRSSTREAGAPGASRSPTGRMIAGSTASRCGAMENWEMGYGKSERACLFCFLLWSQVRSLVRYRSIDWFISSFLQRLVKLNKRPPLIGRPGECVTFPLKSVATFQMLCTICTLPGHLPCVHETSDFRQRKLVIETFGWLAFKEWFREPDFWR